MKKLLAVSEGPTGLNLIVHPPIVIRLWFGSEISGAGVWMSRIAGISLIALGVACWPDRNPLWAFFACRPTACLQRCISFTSGSTVERGFCSGHSSLLTQGCLSLVWRWRKERQAPRHRPHLSHFSSSSSTLAALDTTQDENLRRIVSNPDELRVARKGPAKLFDREHRIRRYEQQRSEARRSIAPIPMQHNTSA